MFIYYDRAYVAGRKKIKFLCLTLFSDNLHKRFQHFGKRAKRKSSFLFALIETVQLTTGEDDTTAELELIHSFAPFHHRGHGRRQRGAPEDRVPTKSGSMDGDENDDGDDLYAILGELLGTRRSSS